MSSIQFKNSFKFNKVTNIISLGQVNLWKISNLAFLFVAQWTRSLFYNLSILFAGSLYKSLLVLSSISTKCWPMIYLLPFQS